MSIPRVTIMGIGNVLWADEGFGVRSIEALHQLYEFPEQVRLIDGGTQGIYLVQHVQTADILVVFDAIDYGLVPGTLKTIEGDAVPNFMGAKKMSLHQTGFQEVLATAELLGDYPEHILLVGVQPEELEDYGGSLRPCVREQIQPAIALALGWLTQHGIQYKKRTTPLPSDQALNAQPLNLTEYESARPSEQQACRLGDERILQDQHMRFDPKPSPLGNDALSVNVDHRVKD